MRLLISEVTKIYNKYTALNCFNCEMSSGVYGLLGPNGAGKTTLINIIVTLLDSTSGDVYYNGENTKKLGTAFLDKIGYLPQYPRFYKNYRAYEFMLYIAALKGIDKRTARDRIEKIFHMVNLSEENNKKIYSFSGGMRQRLGIAQAMLNNPDILILDEPTAGLDPKERIRFRNLISRLGENRIIVFATHIVPDIEYIAKEVILIGDGKKLYQDKPEALMDKIRGKVWDIVTFEDSELNYYMNKYNITNIVRNNEGYHLRIVSDERPSNNALILTPNLEDLYMYCFGESSL